MADDFVRDGRSLADWLPDLLGPDPSTRRRAENAVCAMKWGAPVADATVHKYRPADFPAHQRAWAAAITSAINDAAFDGEAFVLATVERMRADARQQQEQRALRDRLLAFDLPTNAGDDDPLPLAPAENGRTTVRLKQLVAEEKVGRLPNSSGPYTLQLVLEHAGPVLLRMADVVRAGIQDRTVAKAMATALQNLGPAALAFAPDLMAVGEHGFRFAAELAAVAREDRTTIERLIELVREGADPAGRSALYTLPLFGPGVVRQVPTLVDDLLAVADTDPARRDAIACNLAVIAPDRADVFERVLWAARPGPPDLRPMEGHPAYQYDATACRRGPALTALGGFTTFADRAVPALVDALTTFDEYDPDESRGGENSRVMGALEQLGPAAAAAVPDIIPHLRDRDGEIDLRVVRFLGRLGPAARAAVGALTALTANSKLKIGGGTAEPTEWSDPLRWALRQIE